MTDQLDTTAIRTRSQQPGYQEGQALIDVIALCDALDDRTLEAATVRQQNARDTFDAMVAMRDSINERIPMPSLESDLAQGPEHSVFCAVVAEAVIGEVGRLRAANERLRAALGDVIDCDHHNHYDGPPPKYVRVARAALAQKETDK